MIGYRTFGRALPWVIHEIPCLLARVTRYDGKWQGKSWRSELSALHRYGYRDHDNFKFGLCLFRGASGYTVVDWHSTSPEMSLLYFTVKNDVLEIRHDKILVYSQPIVDGVWLWFDVFILFSQTGHVTITLDGDVIVDEYGRTLYAPDDKSYFQAGVYKFTDWADNEDQIKVYVQI